jgi:hypothetical protein
LTDPRTLPGQRGQAQCPATAMTSGHNLAVRFRFDDGQARFSVST